MSQHDYTIANQTASNARTDINNALKALASTNSGTAAPSTTYANMLWYETDTNTLWMRNEANSGWLRMGYVDQTDGLQLIDDSAVVTTGGTQTGKLGGHSVNTWNAGTSGIEALISPATLSSVITGTGGIISEVDLTGDDGKIKLFNGFKMIWGKFTSTVDDQVNVTFWEAFDTACYGVMNAGIDYNTNLGETWVVMNISTTGFTSNRGNGINGTPTFRYVAIGKD